MAHTIKSWERLLGLICSGLSILLCNITWVYPQGQIIRFRQTNHQAHIKRIDIENKDGGVKFIRQLSLPQSFDIRVGANGNLTMNIIRVLSTYSIDTQQNLRFRFDDWTDVKIKGSYLLNHNWLFTLGLNLPTGKEGFSQEEFVVAKVIAEDAFDFPVTLYGSGYEGSLGMFKASKMGSSTVGLGLTYYTRSGYRFFENDKKSVLKPGDEFTGILGLSRPFGSGKLVLNVYATRRKADAFDDKKVYKPGHKIVVKLSASLKRYPLSAKINLINRFQFGAGFLSAADSLGLFRDDISENPYQFELHLIIGQTLRRLAAQITYFGDLKIFRPNEDGSEDAQTFGAGVATHIRPVKWLLVGARGGYYVGNLTSRSENLTFKGYRLSMGLTLQKP